MDGLLAGARGGLVATAALDVLGDLTSAVRSYAVTIGAAAAALLFVTSVVLSLYAAEQAQGSVSF